MRRDLSIFPDDDNGDVLWRMQSHGDDLSKPREIEFSVVFPSHDAALKFGQHMLENGHRIELSEREDDEDFPWEATVASIMLPTHKNITNFESSLERDAAPFEGRNDGWGCYQRD